MLEIYSLAAAVTISSLLALLMLRFRQPLVVSFLLTGVALSFFLQVRADQLTFFTFLPDIGLAFLLFLVGMELNLGELKRLGKNVFIAGLSQVALGTFLVTLILAAMGVASPAVALFALATTFSSTILVVKLLIEEKELVSLHGKLAVGVLLLEDLLAIVVLMLLAVFGTGMGVGALDIIVVLLKGGFLIWLALFSGRRVLPKIFDLCAQNTELLFLAGIAWCLVFVSFSLAIGFSLGIGAFLAGVSLAQSVYRLQISARVKPLRDFFIMLFFIDLGASASLSAWQDNFLIVLVVLVYSLFLKPAIFFLLFCLLRFRSHSAFQTSVLLSSISEFSLITVFFASRSEILPKSLTSPLIFAAVISFIVSSFLITHRHAIFHRLSFLLRRFERKKTLSFDFLPEEQKLADHAVLIGCHRSGEIILKTLKKHFVDNLVVVDFNPEVVEKLKGSYTTAVYGDIADLEIQDKLNLKYARLVISTVRDLKDNLFLLDHLEKIQSKATTIVTASDRQEGITLYERGAHHVSLPQSLEGHSISRLLSDYHGHLTELAKERERKLGELKHALS